MVRTAQKTLYATDLNLCMLSGVPYAPLPNTTLNEKFGVNANVNGPADKYPTMKYFCIGVGGQSPIQGDKSYISSEHSPIDAALFQHIPFIVRPVRSDLSVDERSKYRLRVLTTIAGVQYACYYLREFGTMEVPNHFNVITTVTPADETKLQYSTINILDTNIPEVLSPVPRNRNVDITKIDYTEKVTKVGRITLEFTEIEMQEIRSAMKILGLNATTIKEVGICSGYDLVTDAGKEVINAQILFHIGIDMPLTIDFNTKASIKRIVELGGEEPLVR